MSTALAAGGDALLHRRTHQGDSCLVSACQQGRAEVVRLLLAERGDFSYLAKLVPGGGAGRL